MLQIHFGQQQKTIDFQTHFRPLTPCIKGLVPVHSHMCGCLWSASTLTGLDSQPFSLPPVLLLANEVTGEIELICTLLTPVKGPSGATLSTGWHQATLPVSSDLLRLPRPSVERSAHPLIAHCSTASLCSSARREHRGCLCTQHTGKQPWLGSWASLLRLILWSVPKIASLEIHATRQLWYSLFKSTTSVMECKQTACLFCLACLKKKRWITL